MQKPLEDVSQLQTIWHIIKIMNSKSIQFQAIIIIIAIRLDWGGMTSISSDFNYLSDVIFQIELQNQF